MCLRLTLVGGAVCFISRAMSQQGWEHGNLRFEMVLDHANKANAEAAKQIKRHAATLLDVDTACEEENRARLDIEDQVGMADRKGRKTER